MGCRSVPSGARLAAERVLQGRLPIDEGLEVGARDGHLQLVPGTAIELPLSLRTACDRTADAVVEFPERNVLLRVVVADGEPVAVWLDVEDDARAPVRIAADGLE